MAPHKVNFITGNANKLTEVKAILEPEIEVLSQPIDLEEVQGTLEGVTEYKCRRAAELVKGPVLVEDTALCYNALNGLPGVYMQVEIASAEAVCTFGYCAGPGEEVIIFQGRCPGKIVLPRGPPAFGWDAIFEYEGQTFAEMDKTEKNKISHRSRALAKLQAWFKDQQ
ncbi:unnamed protein product [Fusarium equiseti]|uniref:Inosine triphosphate pyrophosphatase n=1 Tax=Fusarium equiseti TaxID=61235 RepID=A0A8J2J1S1_FUSEQ|nr:unnamed protein product [Fusarium equiseti]